MSARSAATRAQRLQGRDAWRKDDGSYLRVDGIGSFGVYVSVVYRSGPLEGQRKELHADAITLRRPKA